MSRFNCLWWTLTILVGGTSLVVADPAPWQRTETRDDCAGFDTLRNPYFGETHVHTGFSFDAVSGGVTLGPRDAYDFAKGAQLTLPGLLGDRDVQLRRSLDFAAVTDHSEFFGEVQVCLTPGLPGYDSTDCKAFRNAIPATDQTSSPGVQLFAVTIPAGLMTAGGRGFRYRDASGSLAGLKAARLSISGGG